MSSRKPESGSKLPKKDAVLKRAEQMLLDPSASEVDLVAEYQTLVASYRKLHHKLHKTLLISDSYQLQTKELAIQLDRSLLKMQQLREVALPICMYCHKIHTSEDYWERLETYFAKHVDILFSHGICPDCVKTAYGKLGERASVQKQAASTPAGGKAGQKKSSRSGDDESLREMRLLLERVAADGNPLTPEIEKIINRYAKLQSRFDKILLISDTYQSQLMDFNVRLDLMARTDLLTGLSGRWEMANCLDIEKSRSERHNSTFSIILADVDQFKSINDSLGHLAGDRVLREIAARINSNCRAEDISARWGGDEFMLLLPETNLRHAAIVAEKIARSVSEAPIIWEQQDIRVSMSFGVGEYKAGNSINQLIQEVDNSLYAAKKAGRNRVVSG